MTTVPINERIFGELYAQRAIYPLGHRYENKNDVEYIGSELQRQRNNSVKFILLTAGYFDKTSSITVKEKLLGKLNLNGIFDVGKLFHPGTGIKFYLYAFTENKPSKIWFGEFSDQKVHALRKSDYFGDIHAHSFYEQREVSGAFSNYLSSIALALSGNKETDYTSDDYRMFARAATDFDSQRLGIDYYKPELIEAEAKIAHEKTARLGEMAEIIYPRGRIETEMPVYTIKLADAAYPFNRDSLQLVREGAATAPLQQGDIVTNSFLNSAYLNMSDRNDLVAANTQIIIRVTSQKISREYLVVYLNSEKMRTYFDRRSKGFMPRLSRKDLADFPAVLPSLEEQSREISENYLKSLTGMADSKVRMQNINKVLFSQKPSYHNPLQSELVEEMRQSLQPIKNVLVKRLFDLDLDEVRKCYNAGAYKGCLVMCGSILEALVLDWLSEIEGKDYFDPTMHTQLKQMINTLKNTAILTAQEAQSAHDIRNFRNLIHPQKSIDSMPISKQLCKDVIDDLKPIVRKRYQNA